ncbi:MAG TPA: nucleotidyltransferase family protein [Candidatus Sulfotelmatobacter sp.]
MPETVPEIASTPGAQCDVEWTLLQAACSANASLESSSQQKNRLRGLLENRLNWESLPQLAERHGVGPLLYKAVSSLGSDAPAGPSLLQQHYQTNLHRTLFLARELIRILDHFDSLAIDVLPYKGVALAEMLYGDIAMRQAGDIDLLIRPQDLTRIRHALAELGYKPHEQFSEAEERAYLRSGYECAFDSNLGRNLLEVQWALQPRFYAVDFEMESLFRRAVTVCVASRNMKTPSLEDLFLILSLHAAKHVWGRLIWLCDISQIQKLPALKWDWIGETAHSLGIARILQVTLLLTKIVLGAPIPAPAEKLLRPDQAAVALANEIAPKLGNRSPHDVESFSYFHLMMRLRERKADRVRFLKRLAFTPGPGEWKSIRLPAPLFPMYRLVRLARLAGRVAKL